MNAYSDQLEKGGVSHLSRLFKRMGNSVSFFIKLWALAGGAIIVGLAVLTAISTILNLTLGAPLSADHELVKHFVAIAVFMFLPYCQLTGANVTVDVFTEGMSEAKKAVMTLLGSLIALGFAVLLFRQMYFGMQSYMRFVEVTPVLGLPLWTAFPMILASLVLLMVASILTGFEAFQRIRGKGEEPSTAAPTVSD